MRRAAAAVRAVTTVLAVAFAAPLAARAQQRAPADTAVVSAADLEQPPQLVAQSCAAPVYPPMLRAARVEGRVLIQAVVDTLGRVEPGSLEILQTGHSQFNDAARRSVVSCRFRPAMAGGRPVRARVHVPISFRLAAR